MVKDHGPGTPRSTALALSIPRAARLHFQRRPRSDSRLYTRASRAGDRSPLTLEDTGRGQGLDAVSTAGVTEDRWGDRRARACCPEPPGPGFFPELQEPRDKNQQAEQQQRGWSVRETAVPPRGPGSAGTSQVITQGSTRSTASELPSPEAASTQTEAHEKSLSGKVTNTRSGGYLQDEDTCGPSPVTEQAFTNC